VSARRPSRPVGRLLTAYGCGALATGLPWPLLLVLVWDQYGDGPHGAWAVGLAGAARMAPYVVLSWAVGSLGDHVRRDRLVRVTMVLRLAFLALGVLAVADEQVGLGILGVALAVTAGTPTYPAIAASMPRLAGLGRARATELLVTIEVGSWVVGPALGGLLLTSPLRSWTLVVSVALAGLACLLATGISLPGPVERAPDAVAGMLRAVVRCRPAVGALALAGLLNLVVTVTGIALLPLSMGAWGTGDSGFGTATACLGFGALGAPALARLVTASVTGRLLALAAVVVLVAASPVQWPALPLLALAGATGVVLESHATGTLQRVVPDRYRAGALGLADTVMVGACLIGSLVAPALTRLTGARPALLLVALVAVLPVLAVRLLPSGRPVTAYDAADERAGAGPHPRGAPPVGAARVA
jgi:transmembrane secretion effector